MNFGFFTRLNFIWTHLLINPKTQLGNAYRSHNVGKIRSSRFGDIQESAKSPHSE